MTSDQTIVFFGSDDFALAHLRALADAGVRIEACVTQPDRPAGRGMKVQVSPIKAFADEKGLRCLQPQNPGEPECLRQLKEVNADLYVVVSYGRFLPAELLELPSHGALNVHASLLPKYRGAAPVNWAIINGEGTTGISIIRLVQKMDAGPVIDQAQIPIAPEDTAPVLRQKLMTLGAERLLYVLDDLPKAFQAGREQEPDDVTFAPKLSKNLGRVDWAANPADLHNLVRGLLPWPCATFRFRDAAVKIAACDVGDVPSEDPPGTVTALNDDGLVVSCARGPSSLLIKAVVPPSGKPMSGRDFANGRHIGPGEMLA